MINRMYFVMDEDLDVYDSDRDAGKAAAKAEKLASDREESFAVMLKVPGPADFPEFRSVMVYDETGRCIWETDVYDAELATL